MGRVFNRQLAMATVGLRAPGYHVQLTREHKEDLLVWEQFLDSFNGRSVWMEGVTNTCDVELFTDADGPADYGAYFQSHWSASPWPVEWLEAGFTRNLVLLELFPIILMVEFWRFSAINSYILTVIIWVWLRLSIVFLLLLYW